LAGYVVMPEHVHLLIGEPRLGTPSTVLQVLKQCVSREIHGQASMDSRDDAKSLPCFWQRRFYDFNVWSLKKRTEKLDYMHMNPVKRGLVAHPKDWPWSSFSFYAQSKQFLIRIDPLP
jgi:REP-associated tyrosine transposase